MTYTDSQIIDAFVAGDCWALALELKARFPHLTVCTLVDPYWAGEDDTYDYMQWTHAVVLDPNTGMYFDAFGKHDPESGFPDWEMFEWEEIYEIPDEDLDEYFSGQTRYYPDADLARGVMLATVDLLVLDDVA